jgi:hypothetical protein
MAPRKWKDGMYYWVILLWLKQNENSLSTMCNKCQLTVLLAILFHYSYCQIEISSELEKNVLKGNAESTVKQFQSLLTNLGSNQFNYEEKESFILDCIISFFENEKVRVINDIEPEGSEDYTVDVYLRNISIWFPAPKEVSFIYTIEKISDVYISDDHSYLFVKIEASRIIDGINNDNTKINNSIKLDIYLKFNIIGGQIKRKARIYSITKHTTDLSYTIVPLSKKYDEVPIIDTTRLIPVAEAPIFDAYPLACTKLNCKTLNFTSEDDFYLYFKSTSEGYISVFLDDGKNSFKLLPYTLDTACINTGMPVAALKEYILFSTEPQFNFNKNKFFVEDTYQLVAETKKDINHVYVLFSKNPFNRIDVRNNKEIKLLSEIDIKKGYSIPQSLSSEEFQNWLNTNINNTNEISIRNLEIAIQK